MKEFACLPSFSAVTATGDSFELYRAAQRFYPSIALVGVAAILKGVPPQDDAPGLTSLSWHLPLRSVPLPRHVHLSFKREDAGQHMAHPHGESLCFLSQLQP